LTLEESIRRFLRSADEWISKAERELAKKGLGKGFFGGKDKFQRAAEHYLKAADDYLQAANLSIELGDVEAAAEYLEKARVIYNTQLKDKRVKFGVLSSEKILADITLYDEQLKLANNWRKFFSEALPNEPIIHYCPVWGCLQHENIIPEGFGRMGVELTDAHYDRYRVCWLGTETGNAVAKRIRFSKIEDVSLGWDDKFKRRYDTGPAVRVIFRDGDREHTMYLCVPGAVTSIGGVLWKRDYAGFTLEEFSRITPYYYSDLYYEDAEGVVELYKVLVTTSSTPPQ